MDTTSQAPAPTPEDAAVAVQVQQFWNQGNQAAALDVLRPQAEANKPWAAALLAWLLMQQGSVGMDESVNWAIRAAQLGAPGQVVNTLNNLIAQISVSPQFSERVPELLEWATNWPGGFDVMGQGWNLISQGHALMGLSLMMTPGQLPLPITEPQLKTLAAQARERLNELEATVSSARQLQGELGAEAENARIEIYKARDDLKTSAKQAGLLVTATSSDATNAMFIDDAKRNAKESRVALGWGLFVLAGAAIVAVLPVVLHYLHLGPKYSTLEQIGIHLASTAALATFAGVLLARARSRDQAAQRANDISTAMGTMISYSNQIADPSERQRFMATMGQLVLQAHLTTGSKHTASDESLSGMIALANLVKPAVNQSQN